MAAAAPIDMVIVRPFHFVGETVGVQLLNAYGIPKWVILAMVLN